MVRCRKTNFGISVIRPNRSGNRHFSLCGAALDGTRSSVHYGYSCIGNDARSNEKPYSTMLAAPGGFLRLGGARVSSQLPELRIKKSSYRRRTEWKFVLERRREHRLLD